MIPCSSIFHFPGRGSRYRPVKKWFVAIMVQVLFGLRVKRQAMAQQMIGNSASASDRRPAVATTLGTCSVFFGVWMFENPVQVLVLYVMYILSIYIILYKGVTTYLRLSKFYSIHFYPQYSTIKFISNHEINSRRN